MLEPAMERMLSRTLKTTTCCAFNQTHTNQVQTAMRYSMYSTCHCMIRVEERVLIAKNIRGRPDQ